MGANSSSSKGNPASHRMSNTHLKEARSRRWRRAQDRKRTRIELQHSQETANRALRAAGSPTPWEVACAARAARRAAAPSVARPKEEQLPAA